MTKSLRAECEENKGRKYLVNDTNPYADAFRQRIEEVLNTKDILLLFAAKDRDMCFCLFWVFNDWAVSGTFFNLKNLF